MPKYALRRRREDVIIQRVHAVQLEERIVADQFRIRMQRSDQRPAREIAVDYQLKDVVMAAVVVEIPEIIVGLIQEVQAIETLHPADFDLYVEVFLVVVEAAPFDGLLELIHADRIGVGNHGPIRRVAVDARDLVRRELENLEFNAGAREREAVG